MDRSRGSTPRKDAEGGRQEDRARKDEPPGSGFNICPIVMGLNRRFQNAPAYVWFLGDSQMEGLVEESKGGIPKTASGKVQKHILRAWSKDLASRDYGKVVS